MNLDHNRARPPIVLCDDGDLDVFENVASAVHDLELADIHERRAFDSLGRPLKVVDNGSWPVDMLLAEGAEPVAEELSSRVKDFIQQVGPDWVGIPEFESASLDELLGAVLRFQAGTPYESLASRLLKRIRLN